MYVGPELKGGLEREKKRQQEGRKDKKMRFTAWEKRLEGNMHVIVNELPI